MPQDMYKVWPQLAAGFAAAMGGFNAGTVLGWSSSGLPLIESKRNESGHPLDPEIGSWIGGSMNIGAAMSLVICAGLLDRIGRKWCMIMTVPLFVVGWLLLGLLDSDINYICMRVVLGMAAGTFCVACPMYAAEIAETRIRGLLGTSFQLFLVHGILFSYLLGLTYSYFLVCLLNLIPVAIFCLWMLFMPRSPFFLLKRNKEENARKALVWLRGGEKAEVDDELNTIKELVAETDERKKMTCKEFFTRKDMNNSMGIAMLLMFCQQLSGINAVIFNMQDIFRDATTGEGLNPIIQAIIVGCVQVVMTGICSWLVEVAGRRLLMLLSMLLMGVFHIGLAVYFFVKHEEGESSAEKIYWLPILSLCGFIAAFSLGAGPLPWSMLGEIFPEEAKSVAASVSGIVNWLLSLLVTKTYVNLKEGLTTEGAFLLYAIICFIGMILLFFFLPETKNREFEDIQGMMKGERPDIAPIGLKR